MIDDERKNMDLYLEAANSKMLACVKFNLKRIPKGCICK